jgi:hypothetical protein
MPWPGPLRKLPFKRLPEGATTVSTVVSSRFTTILRIFTKLVFLGVVDHSREEAHLETLFEEKSFPTTGIAGARSEGIAL